MKTKTKARKGKAARSSATKKTKGEKPSKAEPKNGKPEKRVEIQGVRVLTPDGKAKTGKRGALTYLSAKQIRIVPGFNPRTTVGDLTELERGIRKSGLISPLTVRPSSDGKMFDLVAGQRRFTVLKNLGAPFTDAIPVNVRTDLEDVLEAKAVAISENSEDGRTNLTPIEIGATAAEMLKKGWSVAQIAGSTGLHPKKLQRCLELVESPKDILGYVEKGEMGMVNALELRKIPEKTRKEIIDQVGPGATVDQIRKVRKQLDREARQEAVAKGKDTSKTKAGKQRKKVVTAWKPAREKQETLRELCHDYINAEERDTSSFYELRGSLGSLFWDRGDLESPILFSLDPSEEEDPKIAKKANVALETLIKNEAALFEPKGEETEEANVA